MILINKNIIEKYVNKISSILISLIIATLPINQQIHFRPFPTVDGFIIDYLIFKVSLPEILILSFLLFNIWRIFSNFNRNNYIFLTIFLALILYSTYLSEYKSVAIYENLIWVSVVLSGVFIYRNPDLINQSILEKLIKFWLIVLFVLGLSQFFNQGSVFNNYRLTGEFPYSESNLFIKQRGNILRDFLPPMGIFSHANIFGAYILFLLVILYFFKKDSLKYHFCALWIIVLTGSLPVILSYFIFLTFKLLTLNLSLFKKYPILKRYKFLGFIIILTAFPLFSILPFVLNPFDFFENFSIFRRVYLFDISENYFIENPVNLFFGSGYYNYFSIIRKDLWNYEVIRFFQPPHNIFVLILWNYGLIFLIVLFLFVLNLKNYANEKTLIFLFLFIFLGSFDHYLTTNHQFRILYFIFPYSIFYKNDVK